MGGLHAGNELAGDGIDPNTSLSVTYLGLWKTLTDDHFATQALCHYSCSQRYAESSNAIASNEEKLVNRHHSDKSMLSGQFRRL